MKNKFPLTRFQRWIERAAWLLAAATVLFTAFRWNTLPKVMAIHYDIYGVADDWGSRWIIWILPVLLAVCCGLVSCCTRLNLSALSLPFQPNMERELFILRAIRDMLCVVNLECAVLFSVLQTEMLAEKHLTLWFLWVMAGITVATVVFGCWRAWKCNQGTL